MNVRVGCEFVCGKCDKCICLIVALCETVVATNRGESLDDLFRIAMEARSELGNCQVETAFSDPYLLDCLRTAANRLSMVSVLLHALLVREFDASIRMDMGPSLFSTKEDDLLKSAQHMGRFVLCVNFAAGFGTSLEQCAMDPYRTNALLLAILQRHSMRHEDVADIVTKWMSMDGRAKPVRRVSIPVPIHLLSPT